MNWRFHFGERQQRSSLIYPPPIHSARRGQAGAGCRLTDGQGDVGSRCPGAERRAERRPGSWAGARTALGEHRGRPRGPDRSAELWREAAGLGWFEELRSGSSGCGMWQSERRCPVEEPTSVDPHLPGAEPLVGNGDCKGPLPFRAQEGPST